jgi:diguanylate cyclase (GGDEF)-like protein
VVGPVLFELAGDRWVQIRGRPTHEGGTVLVHEDVTRWRRAERQLRHLATHDALTGLPARRHFESRLMQILKAAERNRHDVAVMFVDVDYFKQVNDTYGHGTGDQVLTIVAKRLRSALRDHDIVSRISGDEFSIVLENTGGTEDIAATAARILTDVSAPIEVPGGTIEQTVSLGIGRYPEDARDIKGLMRCADEACYAAKHSGRNKARFYSNNPSQSTL